MDEDKLEVTAKNKGEISIDKAELNSSSESQIGSKDGGKLTMRDTTSKTPYSNMQGYGGAALTTKNDAVVLQRPGMFRIVAGPTGEATFEGSFVFGPRDPDDPKGFSVEMTE